MNCYSENYTRCIKVQTFFCSVQLKYLYYLLFLTKYNVKRNFKKFMNIRMRNLIESEMSKKRLGNFKYFLKNSLKITVYLRYHVRKKLFGIALMYIDWIIFCCNGAYTGWLLKGQYFSGSPWVLVLVVFFAIVVVVFVIVDAIVYVVVLIDVRVVVFIVVFVVVYVLVVILRRFLLCRIKFIVCLDYFVQGKIVGPRQIRGSDRRIVTRISTL